MRNLESVAQKMAELLHQVRKRTLSITTTTPLISSLDYTDQARFCLFVSSQSLDNIPVCIFNLGNTFILLFNFRDSVAIVVPYRDRPDHLRILINHIHPFLMRQNLHYQVFVINQVSSLKHPVRACLVYIYQRTPFPPFIK